MAKHSGRDQIGDKIFSALKLLLDLFQTLIQTELNVLGGAPLFDHFISKILNLFIVKPGDGIGQSFFQHFRVRHIGNPLCKLIGFCQQSVSDDTAGRYDKETLRIPWTRKQCFQIGSGGRKNPAVQGKGIGNRFCLFHAF